MRQAFAVRGKQPLIMNEMNGCDGANLSGSVKSGGRTESKRKKEEKRGVKSKMKFNITRGENEVQVRKIINGKYLVFPTLFLLMLLSLVVLPPDL